MLATLASTPLYKSFRTFDWPKMIPLNFTLLISTKCNSRCKTCNIWKQIRNDLTMDEWEKVLTSVGIRPYWFTISGGEPFLPDHTAELAKAIYDINKPGVINIPTNSLLVDKVARDVESILKHCKNTQLVINLSLDGIGEMHDYIRGVPGNFEKVMANYKNMMRLKKYYPQLTVGFHTVISKFNHDHVPALIDFCYKLKPDQYISEIAEQRVELDTVGLDITPELDQYQKTIDYLIEKMLAENVDGFGKITRAFRLQYYDFVKRWRAGEPVGVEDYAGWSSCEISSWGEVWPSCIGGINLGNVRDHEYDFRDIWFGKRAEAVRQKMKPKEESFPLANAFYTNALCNYNVLGKVLLRLIKNE